MLPRRKRGGSLVLPVGASEEWFRAGAARPVLAPRGGHGPLRVIFFGLFTPLQGSPVIGHAIADLARPGTPVQVTLVGTGQDEGAARSALGDAAVTWLPWVEPGDLPDLVARHDVCLGIFGTSDKAARVIPNKVYQGMAAGCAVVTSDTPAQRAVLEDAVAYVAPGDPGALAHVLRSLADDRLALRSLAARGVTLARERFSPAAIGALLADALGGERG